MTAHSPLRASGMLRRSLAAGRRVAVILCWCCLASLAQGVDAAEPPITALAFAPEGDAVLASSLYRVQVREYPSLQVRATIPTGLKHVHDLAFSPRGDTLAMAGGSPGEAGEVELWSWPARQRIAAAAMNRDVVYRAAWEADGAALWTAGADGHVVRLDRRLQVDKRLKGHARGVLAIVLLPDDSPLTAGVDQSLRWWERAQAPPRRVLDQHTGPVVDLALRPGKHPAAWVASAGGDKTIRFWQPALGRMVRFARLPVEPLALVWLPDGSQVAATGTDGNVYRVDAETAEVAAPQAALSSWAYALAAAPQDPTLVVGGEEGKIVLVRLARDAP